MIDKIFFIALFINLLYEVSHSVLYKTCHEAKLPKYVYLMLKGAIFDGFSIAIIYFITYSIFANKFQIITFLISSLMFAYVWEIYSLKKGKWEYTDKMPTVFGAGITPFIQLAATGCISIYLASNFC